ncbi:IS3 family transposase [Corynebacterium curieae]|uniref:IS3 family transposase n=1 Tax=Corynebacterium curieae TaxID=2913500 RepID=UPI0030B813DD
MWACHRGVYGRRKLWKAALQEGWAIGRDQVERLMKILGNQKVLQRKAIRTTQSHPKRPALC